VVVRSSEDINSLADLRGKRVAVGRAGSGTLLTSEALLASAGLSFDDIDPEYIGQGEALDALKNGVIDAAPISGGIPISALTEALTTAGDELAIYSMTPEEQQAFIETSGWKVSDTLPAGTYPGQDEPITTTAHMALLMVPADFPEDLGRDILDLIYNRIDELRAAHGVYKSVSEEAAKSAIDQLTVPLAAGTKAYFGME
jgi:TRAP transporter TAXI family solute receptor